MSQYRVRIIPEGRGFQLRAWQEFFDEAEIPKAYKGLDRLAFLSREAMQGFTDTLKEARDAERDVANDHPLPPGVGYGDPETLMILVELVPG